MPILSDRFNLTVIDKAYGPSADLYVDVLRVSYLASDEEIQSAFFDRRSEIFTILSKITHLGLEPFGGKRVVLLFEDDLELIPCLRPSVVKDPFPYGTGIVPTDPDSLIGNTNRLRSVNPLVPETEIWNR